MAYGYGYGFGLPEIKEEAAAPPSGNERTLSDASTRTLSDGSTRTTA